MDHKLIKTDYGYDYRGVAITRRKDGFTYGVINKFNYTRESRLLRECIVDIDTYLDNVDATVERYRIKISEYAK